MRAGGRQSIANRKGKQFQNPGARAWWPRQDASSEKAALAVDWRPLRAPVPGAAPDEPTSMGLDGRPIATERGYAMAIPRGIYRLAGTALEAI
jgi:hypothetical protein